ncbi:MAG: DUF1778 domain-containing protein [Planctomycetes bacterium]|nr:DUF1778 domain-containing protein [Planctomycetota bacterium]
MSLETKSTDAKARLTLPRGFANTTVIIEEVSDVELRIRKALVVPQDEVQFIEERSAPLSNRDRDRFLKMLENPPSANEALKRAFKRSESSGG